MAPPQEGIEVPLTVGNNSKLMTDNATALRGDSSSDEEVPTTTIPPTDYKRKKDDSDSTIEAENLFQFLTGMKDDLKARAPHYKDDWGKPKNVFTVVNATIFTFVIQLIPALIFAELMDRQTDGNLSVAEVILSTAIMGIIYAIFSGQPLVVMGITGPVALLLGTSYGLTKQFEAEYFPFFFWTCVWAGLMHIISAMVGLVSLVWKVTPFSSQIFEFFIAITFIYSSLNDLIQPIYLWEDPNVTAENRSAGYAAFLIGLLTCWISWSLHFAETWIFFPRELRTFLTSYSTLIAVVIATAFSYIPGFDQNGSLERVYVVAPWDWQPSADRPWVVNPLTGIDAKGIFGALIPGFMFFLLFIIDHNVSSILTQVPKFNLKKPSAYHWDFFIVGITFFPCAILGLPPGNGLIPQAPLHCRALCTREYITDRFGVRREVVTHCEEQRWSGLGQASLMFVALACFSVISWIPNGCLFGLLLYLGMSALHGNEIWERLLLFFVYPKKRPLIPVVRHVRWWVVQVWTLVQVACACTIFAVAQFASVGYIYPALLALLVPFRSYILHRCFKEEDMKHLDPSDETEEEFHEEQRMIHENERHGSFDEEDIAFPTRAAFRGQSLKRALMNSNRRHTIGHESDDILSLDVAKAAINLDEHSRAEKATMQEVVGARPDVDAKERASKIIERIHSSMADDDNNEQKKDEGGK